MGFGAGVAIITDVDFTVDKSCDAATKVGRCRYTNKACDVVIIATRIEGDGLPEKHA